MTWLKLLRKYSKIILKKIQPGIIVVNKENARNVKNFKTFISGHPIPNFNGLKASLYLEKYLRAWKENDLVLVFLSEGGSALLPYPVNGIALKDKIQINKQLIESGADIKEINTVKKTLIKNQGGNLIKFTYPSKVHCFILSDVIGDDISSISSGLTSPDSTTFNELAKKFLLNINYGKIFLENVKNHLEKGLGKSELETPKKNK